MNLESFVSFSKTVHQLLDENELYLSQLTSLLQDANQEMEHSVMVGHGGIFDCRRLPVVGRVVQIFTQLKEQLLKLMGTNAN